MLRPRIIPCLLIHNNGLVKTIGFSSPKYVGDPLNAVRIFNEKEVDELVVLDIDASVQNRPPNFELIKNIAAECRMPLCYGGGVATAEHARKIIGLGVEKVAISSAAIANPKLITEIADCIGKQSVVVVLDVKRNFMGRYGVFTGNGKKRTKIDPLEFAVLAQEAGAGEIAVNSIDQDGSMKGFDLTISRQIRDVTSVPMTVIGGAGHLDDIAKLVEQFGLIGAACGSLFVFKGKYRAVLISYPTKEQKLAILARNKHRSPGKTG